MKPNIKPYRFDYISYAVKSQTEIFFAASKDRLKPQRLEPVDFYPKTFFAVSTLSFASRQ